MTIEQFMRFQNRMVRAAEDGTGGGAGGEGGEGGAGGAGGEGGEGAGGGAGGEGGEGGTGGEGGEGGTSGEGGEGGGAKWWESNKLSDIQRSTITAAGLTVDDPVEAVAKLADMEAAAQRKLGAKPEELMRRPKEGQDVAEWLRENGDVFGIPEAPEKYEVKPPESWPKDAKWDEGLETDARKIAHEEGLSGRALQRLTDLYAGKVAQLSGDLEADQAAAVTEMNEALQKEWGDQFNAKTVQARQAMSAVMERAGIDPEGMQNVLNLLSSKGGDPETMRVFAAIGEMMGDDMLVGNGDGESTIGETPASARAKIEAMKKDGSPYREAQKQANKTGDKSEFARLHKQYLALQKIAAR